MWSSVYHNYALKRHICMVGELVARVRGNLFRLDNELYKLRDVLLHLTDIKLTIIIAQSRLRIPTICIAKYLRKARKSS